MKRKLHSENPSLNDGPVKEFTEFSYDAVEEDHSNPLAAIAMAEPEEPDPMKLASDGFSEILAFCWSHSANEMHPAFLKFVAVTALVNPMLLHNQTYKQLAEKLGVTKAALSKVALAFQDKFKLKFRRSRPAISRKRMARKMKGNHNRHNSHVKNNGKGKWRRKP